MADVLDTLHLHKQLIVANHLNKEWNAFAISFWSVEFMMVHSAEYFFTAFLEINHFE